MKPYLVFFVVFMSHLAFAQVSPSPEAGKHPSCFFKRPHTDSEPQGILFDSPSKDTLQLRLENGGKVEIKANGLGEVLKDHPDVKKFIYRRSKDGERTLLIPVEEIRLKSVGSGGYPESANFFILNGSIVNKSAENFIVANDYYIVKRFDGAKFGHSFILVNIDSGATSVFGDPALNLDVEEAKTGQRPEDLSIVQRVDPDYEIDFGDKWPVMRIEPGEKFEYIQIFNEPNSELPQYTYFPKTSQFYDCRSPVKPYEWTEKTTLADLCENFKGLSDALKQSFAPMVHTVRGKGALIYTTRVGLRKWEFKPFDCSALVPKIKNIESLPVMSNCDNRNDDFRPLSLLKKLRSLSVFVDNCTNDKLDWRVISTLNLESLKYSFRGGHDVRYSGDLSATIPRKLQNLEIWGAYDEKILTSLPTSIRELKISCYSKDGRYNRTDFDLGQISHLKRLEFLKFTNSNYCSLHFAGWPGETLPENLTLSGNPGKFSLHGVKDKNLQFNSLTLDRVKVVPDDLFAIKRLKKFKLDPDTTSKNRGDYVGGEEIDSETVHWLGGIENLEKVELGIKNGVLISKPLESRLRTSSKLNSVRIRPSRRTFQKP